LWGGSAQHVATQVSFSWMCFNATVWIVLIVYIDS